MKVQHNWAKCAVRPVFPDYLSVLMTMVKPSFYEMCRGSKSYKQIWWALISYTTPWPSVCHKQAIKIHARKVVHQVEIFDKLFIQEIVERVTLANFHFYQDWNCQENNRRFRQKTFVLSNQVLHCSKHDDPVLNTFVFLPTHNSQ